MADMVYCRGCGKEIHVSAITCPNCGMRQRASSEKNKLVAFLLAWFMGGVGIHRFYLGNIGLGLLYLIFCWTLIPSIAAFFEGIVFLCTSDEKWNAKYGV